jgi:FixJ family two-component response regulator
VNTHDDRLTADIPPDGTAFIVDDDEQIRRLLCSLVQSAGIASAAFASAEEFLEQFDDQQVGCLVLDIGLPGINGMELQQRLCSARVGLPIVFVTGREEVSLATQALRAGAIDFLTKPCDPTTLIARIREGFVLHRQLRERRALAADVKQRMTALTGRENEIMQLLAAGDSTKKIAAQLSISLKTVDNYRIKLFEKMEVENATQLSRLLGFLE